jgi:hypothetical protein
METDSRGGALVGIAAFKCPQQERFSTMMSHKALLIPLSLLLSALPGCGGKPRVEFHVPQGYQGKIYLVANRADEKGPNVSSGGSVSVDPRGVGFVHSGSTLEHIHYTLVAVYPNGHEVSVFPSSAQAGGSDFDVQILTIGEVFATDTDMRGPREQAKAVLAHPEPVPTETERGGTK